jgi:hypothetical protein
MMSIITRNSTMRLLNLKKLRNFLYHVDQRTAMEHYELCHAEHTAMKNYANVPDAWHIFAETGQSGKINLTTFHKAIYDYIDSHHIPYELTRYRKQVKFDEELSSILKVPELLVE